MAWSIYYIHVIKVSYYIHVIKVSYYIHVIKVSYYIHVIKVLYRFSRSSIHWLEPIIRIGSSNVQIAE